MPLARISLLKGKPPELRRKIGDAVHRALRDRFQLLTEHEPGDPRSAPGKLSSA